MSISRKSYTMPIPADAKLVDVGGVPHAKFKYKRRGKMRTITAPLTADGKRVRVESPCWYGRVDGVLVRLFTDEEASISKLAELIRKSERSKTDLHDPYADHLVTPIMAHIDDWRASISRNAGKNYVDHATGYVRKMAAACGFRRLADITAVKVEGYLVELAAERCVPVDPSKAEYTRRELADLLGIDISATTSLIRRHRLAGTGSGKARRYPKETAERLASLRRRGKSVKTVNDYLQAIKSFCAWLVRNKRMAESPVAHLAGGNVKTDRRHDRRILDEAELRMIFAAAGCSQREFRGLTGPDREVLYRVACVTGFRASELAVLCPMNFDLVGSRVSLSGAHTKNEKSADQPLPRDLVDVLRAYFAGKNPDAPLWPGTWHERASDMIRIELDACGIPYAVEGPDGPLFADMHCLRHSFIALLDRSGATLKEAMQLARHSDPKLTVAVYGKARAHDLASAVDRLGMVSGGSHQASSGLPNATKIDERLPFPCRADDDTGSHQMTPAESCKQAIFDNLPQVGLNSAFDDAGAPEMATDDDMKNSPTRTRTLNLAVNSRSLAPFSDDSQLALQEFRESLAVSLPRREAFGMALRHLLAGDID